MKNTHWLLEAPTKIVACLVSILITSPKIHSTEVRTRLMDKLKASIPRVNLASLNGAGVGSTTGGGGGVNFMTSCMELGFLQSYSWTSP